MATQTTNDLEDRLDAAISWRRTELHALKSALESAFRNSTDGPMTRALARSSVALLYAHWEGFAKDACQAYVDFVAMRRLRFNELNDGFLATSLSALSKRIESGDESAISLLLDVVRRPDMARARIPKSSIVDTKSNLRYKVLTEIFSCIGFSTSKFETKDKLIDRSLCDTRNSIAHGREYFPDPAAFPALHDEVIEMIEDLRDLIMSSVRLQDYKSPVPKGAVKAIGSPQQP